MISGRLAALLLITGVGATAGTIGCFTTDDGILTSDDAIKSVDATDTTALILKSTVLLESGCTAAKVGPRHLLVAARCVIGHDEYATGETLKLRVADGATARKRRKIAADAGVPDDAGADDAGAGDAGDAGGADELLAPTIAKIAVNDSFAAKCAAESCAFGTLAAGDVKDVAVIVLDADLKSIPTIPVDLDSVSEGDTLFQIGGGCRTLDAPPRRERVTRTNAVAADAATHRGSTYAKSPALVARLDASYVVTPGRGWTPKASGMCSTDLGAPLFRASATPAVAGITAGYTLEQQDDPMPVTVHHTRVDTKSTVGPWLESLGVTTIHSCTGTGCTKAATDPEMAGVPTASTMELARKATDTDDDDSDTELVADDDAGTDAGPRTLEGTEIELGDGTHDGYSTDTRTPGGDGGTAKKKMKTVMACGATPGPINSGGSSALAFGVVGLALVSRARRRGAPRRALPRDPSSR